MLSLAGKLSSVRASNVYRLLEADHQQLWTKSHHFSHEFRPGYHRKYPPQDTKTTQYGEFTAFK